MVISLPRRFFSRLRIEMPNALILAFDDMGEKFQSGAHGLVNFSLSSHAMELPAGMSQTSLWGTRFYPVSAELRKVAERRKQSPRCGRLGITMGRSDPEHQSERILGLVPQLLDRVGHQVEVVIILGPHFEDATEFESRASVVSGVHIIETQAMFSRLFHRWTSSLRQGG